MFTIGNKIKLLLIVVLLLSGCGGGSKDDPGINNTIDNLNPGITFSPGQQGTINFNSLSPRNIQQLVTSNVDTTAVTVSGILTLPTQRNGKIPAMIILHSSVGITNYLYDYWAPFFTSNGIAAFVIDSYSARNPDKVASGQNLISTAVQAVDAMEALKLLSQHPDIDASRIAVIGFSAGAIASRQLTFAESRTDFLRGNLTFAAYIEFYPVCEVRQWSPNIVSQPILTLLGALDQNGAASSCVEFNTILKNNGANITTKVYPGVYHAFDSAGFTTLNDLLVFTTCSAEFRFDTLVKSNFNTGQVYANFREYFDYRVQCTRETLPNKITLGGSQQSVTDSSADVISFLNTAFVMP